MTRPRPVVIAAHLSHYVTFHLSRFRLLIYLFSHICIYRFYKYVAHCSQIVECSAVAQQAISSSSSSSSVVVVVVILSRQVRVAMATKGQNFHIVCGFHCFLLAFC